MERVKVLALCQVLREVVQLVRKACRRRTWDLNFLWSLAISCDENEEPADFR